MFRVIHRMARISSRQSLTIIITIPISISRGITITVIITITIIITTLNWHLESGKNRFLPLGNGKNWFLPFSKRFETG